MAVQMVLKRNIVLALVAVIGSASCLASFSVDTQDPVLLRRSFDFREGAQGWEAGVSDSAPEQEELLMFEAGLRHLPVELKQDGTGFYIQGTNRSDDPFMFLKRRLGPEDGVHANQSYQVNFRLVFASNAPSGCFGGGGAPGESVYLKAGAGPMEPISVFVEDEKHYRMNVDKGNQAVGGPAASIVGHIANGIPCQQVPDLEDPPTVSLRRVHRRQPAVTANADGEIWLLVGTDSDFESKTALYDQRIDVWLAPVDSDG